MRILYVLLLFSFDSILHFAQIDMSLCETILSAYISQCDCGGYACLVFFLDTDRPPMYKYMNAEKYNFATKRHTVAD